MPDTSERCEAIETTPTWPYAKRCTAEWVLSGHQFYVQALDETLDLCKWHLEKAEKSNLQLSATPTKGVGKT